MSHQEARDAGFTALPAGWYNYYRDNGRVFRTPCPGILKIDHVLIHDNGNEEHQWYTFDAATMEGGQLIEASGSNFIGCFYGEEFWDEVAQAPDGTTK